MVKKTLLIDVDDVIVENFLIPLVNKYFKLNLTLLDFEYEGAYIEDIFKKYSDEEAERFYDFFFAEKCYSDKYIKIKPHAVEVIKQLNEIYEVYFCTDGTIWQRPQSSYLNMSDKFQMLVRHFNFVNPSNFIFMRGKHLVKADILIDDRPHNLTGDLKQKFLFTAYHNKGMSDIELKQRGLIRVNSWKEIARILLNNNDI